MKNVMCELFSQSTVPKDRIVLVSESDQASFGEIVKLSESLGEELPELKGKICAVTSEDRFSLAKFFLPLIQTCKTLFLLPQDIKDISNELLKAANVELIINLSAGKISSIDVFESSLSSEARNLGRNELLMATSGTTGSPKLVSYSLSVLVKKIKRDNKGQRNFVWGLTYDINRFAGLQVFIQSFFTGAKLVVSSSTDNINSTLQLFALHSVNCLSATPSYWRKLVMYPSHKQLKLENITLGGEIATSSILNVLKVSFPQASIRHIYASTEAGVGFSVKDKQEGFPVTYLSHEGVEGCFLKLHNDTLWIKNSFGCEKIVKGQIETDDEGFMNTGDMVAQRGNRIIFLGRESGSINVGGNKVMPESVEAILESNELVQISRVYSKKSSVLGSLVAADIVCTEKGQKLCNREIKSELINFCKNYLAPHEVPIQIKVVESISMNATGKKERNSK